MVEPSDQTLEGCNRPTNVVCVAILHFQHSIAARYFRNGANRPQSGTLCSPHHLRQVVAFRSQEHDQGCLVGIGSIASGGSELVFGVGGKRDIPGRAISVSLICELPSIPGRRRVAKIWPC